MAGISSPYIKPEPTDFGFDPNQYMQLGQGSHFSSSSANINPANLSTGNNMSQSFGQGGMSSSYNLGNSGIADDELLDLDIGQTGQSGGYDFGAGMQNFLMNNQQNASLYSHTPDGAPMHSPFTGEFNYGHFRPAVAQQQFGGRSLPQQTAFRPQLQHMKSEMSNPRSPAAASHLLAGDDFQHPGMQTIQHHRQQASIGNGWDSTPSHQSWNESSPFPSPTNGQPMHTQISEVLRNNGQHPSKVASSLPTKMEGGAQPGFQTQEAKRRRRRESHNLVERRRRDNINERIQDLGVLVPQHRLEDEKVRKHLQTNAPLSPSITNAGLSPPNAATSLLAGGHGRRATSGNITQGLPIEDKDKGPNKGDILNGSVAWVRDLMWYMEKKLREERQMKQTLQQLGAPWLIEETEDERRMLSEILEVIDKNSDGSLSSYSRAPGSGLRVPGFTNVSGESVNASGQVIEQQEVSPGFQPGGSGMSSGRMSHQNQTQFWEDDFKEEDEYEMEMQ